MPPIYLLEAVGSSGLIAGPVALIRVQAIWMLYSIIAAIYILAADKPRDKSKRASYDMA